MILRVILVATIVGLTAQSPGPVPSATPRPRTCDQSLAMVRELMPVTTSDTARSNLSFAIARSEMARVSSLDGHELAADAVASISTCPAGPKRDLLRAYALSWRGFVEYYNADDRWHDDLNLSDQLFKKCVDANAGTMQGARCATGIETNARWRRDWGG